VIFAVFVAIGVGLALPFTIVAAIPGLSRWLPRSGRWMLTLRALLAFALLATVVWLAWILGRAAGADAMARLLAWLLALAFGTWLFFSLRGSPRAWQRAGAALSAALLLVAGAGVVGTERAGTGAPDGADRDARRYDAAAVAAERSAGRPVFVYFTADWCLTCKVNERVVLSDESVRGELERANYAVFEADWTRRDERIRSELERFGRAGVPLYLLFPPGDGAPLRLPELLTRDAFVEALRRTAVSRVRGVTLSPVEKSISGLLASKP
jgi:thiol:disulfide interchange protein DsbD